MTDAEITRRSVERFCVNARASRSSVNTISTAPISSGFIVWTV
ncbi:MAG: hypothetical protein NTW05_11480 [Pseudonocardiales bacterium]|nr:hypothetical protein [Pseudonocardiales bacterium]